MGFENPVVGGTALRAPAIQSPDYTPGSAGWIIKIDGSAEFNNLVVRGVFEGNNFVIDSSGVFLYSGTPAAGNMSGSWASAAGTDAFGNAYPQGLKIYSTLGSILLSAVDGVFQSTGSSGAIVDINDGQVTFARPGDNSTAVIIQDLIALRGSLYLSGGKTGANDKSGLLGIVTSNGVPTSGNQDTYPRTSSTEYSQTFEAYHYVSGAVVKSDNSGVTSEVWHTPSYNANWSGTTTFGTISNGLGALKYRKDAEDNLQIIGTFTAAAGAGSAVFQLPAGYRPLTNWPFPVAFISSGGVAGNAWMYISTAGNLNINSQLGAAVTTGTAYTVNAKIPLGNIA